MLQRATDWFRAGGGNHQVLAGKPGGCTAGAAGRERRSGSGAGSRGQRIGSGQTCPVGPRARAVVAARCRRRGASRGRACRGRAGVLAVPCQPDVSIQRREVQGASIRPRSWAPMLPPAGQAELRADVAVCRGVGFRGDDGGVRGDAGSATSRSARSGPIGSVDGAGTVRARPAGGPSPPGRRAPGPASSAEGVGSVAGSVGTGTGAVTGRRWIGSVGGSRCGSRVRHVRVRGRRRRRA